MTGNGAAPRPERLFTWVDVNDYFMALAMAGGWPDWLVEVDAFWDGVEVTVAEDADEGEMWAWLASALGPRAVDRAEQAIILEPAGDRGERLPVFLRRAAAPAYLDRAPRWNEHRIVKELADGLPRPASETFGGDVKVCAFHSFKGGVGKTLHCFALARELARSPAAGGRRVLLVDADLEAPGIAWMWAAAGRRADIALVDVIAVLHGSRQGDITESLVLAQRFLPDQEIDGVVVLPAWRSPGQLIPPRIAPVNLLTATRSPYFVTESLAAVAATIGADVVLVDLGVGVSELSAPFLLDPRVLRVFVTTTDDQSLWGTLHVLRQVERRAPSCGPTDPGCAVLVTHVDELEHGSAALEAVTELRAAVADTHRRAGTEGGTRTDLASDAAGHRLLVSPLDSRLVALPGAWDDVASLVDRIGLGERMTELADCLRLPPRVDRPSRTPALGGEAPSGCDGAALRGTDL